MNVHDTLRNLKACHVIATGKRTLPDTHDTLRNLKACHVIAIGKRPLPDACNGVSAQVGRNHDGTGWFRRNGRRPGIAGPDLRLAVEDAVRIRVVAHGRRPAPLGVVRHVVRDGGLLGGLFAIRRRPPALERIPRVRGRGRQGTDLHPVRALPLFDDALFRPKGDRVRLVVVVQRRVAAIREDVCAQLPLQMLRHPHVVKI